MNQPANEKGGQTEVLLVNSVLVDCVGVGPMKCMQVRAPRSSRGSCSIPASRVSLSNRAISIG